MFTTYILYSNSARRYYVGSTHNLLNRLREHNAGETSSILYGIPWDVVWSMGFPSRTEAVALERRIKARGIARFLEDKANAQHG